MLCSEFIYPVPSGLAWIILKMSPLRLSSSKGHVDTIEVRLFCHHPHLRHCSWLCPYVIVILYRHKIKVLQCIGGNYGFLKNHTIFITEYSTQKLTEFFMMK